MFIWLWLRGKEVKSPEAGKCSKREGGWGVGSGQPGSQRAGESHFTSTQEAERGQEIRLRYKTSKLTLVSYFLYFLQLYLLKVP